MVRLWAKLVWFLPEVFSLIFLFCALQNYASTVGPTFPGRKSDSFQAIVTERQSDNNASKTGMLVILRLFSLYIGFLISICLHIGHLISYRWNQRFKCFLLGQNYVFCAVEGLICDHAALQQIIFSTFCLTLELTAQAKNAKKTNWSVY